MNEFIKKKKKQPSSLRRDMTGGGDNCMESGLLTYIFSPRKNSRIDTWNVSTVYGLRKTAQGVREITDWHFGIL